MQSVNPWLEQSSHKKDNTDALSRGISVRYNDGLLLKCMKMVLHEIKALKYIFMNKVVLYR